MKSLINKLLNSTGYELKKTTTKTCNNSCYTNYGPLLNHNNKVDIFQFCSGSTKGTICKQQFIQKIESGHYKLANHNCPICQSLQFTPVANGEFEFKWGVCQQCGLLQCFKRLEEPSLNEFYQCGEYQQIIMQDLDDELHYKIEYKVNSLCFTDIFQKLNINFKTQHILEIGCGSGGILRALQDLGATVYGFDIDPYRIEQGKKHINNLYVQDAMDQSYELPQQINYIILSNILEHLNNPLQFLQDIHDKIAKHNNPDNIKLLIDVPNLETAYSYHQGEFGKFLHIAHLWYFNSITIERLLNLAGFGIEYIFSRDSSFSIVATWQNSIIENNSNAYWNSISSINFANYIFEDNNLKTKVAKAFLEIS